MDLEPDMGKLGKIYGENEEKYLALELQDLMQNVEGRNNFLSKLTWVSWDFSCLNAFQNRVFGPIMDMMDGSYQSFKIKLVQGILFSSAERL